MRLHRLPAVAAAAATLLAPALAGAQAVRGAVTDAASTAIPGVVVLLLDSAGAEVGRALTNERGEYRIQAPDAGTYRLRTLRIGFSPAVSDPLVLGPRQEIPRDLTVTSVALALDTVRVIGRNLCRAHAEADAGVAVVWEQARAALMAAKVTAGTGSIAATVVTYQRALEPGMRRVVDQASAIRSGFYTRPWASLPADSLRKVGYVVEGRDGWLTYYAPDIDVLLSNTFLEDHCFRLATARDASLVGVAFEPTRDRSRIPEIRGTVWVDRRSSQLRSMEFRYVNVSREQEQAGAGGSLAFSVMANGGWAISAWHIQMPLLRRAEVGPRLSRATGGAQQAQRVVLAEVRVAGGELALAMRGRDTLWARPPLVLVGSVVDSVSGRALAGARVSLQGTELETESDAAGRFSLSGVLPGRYTLEVRTPSLDQVGAAHQTPVSIIDAADAVRVRVATAEQVAASLCGDARLLARTSKEGILFCSVYVRTDSAPPRDVRVLVEWDAYERAAGPVGLARARRWSDARTDAEGFFRVCGVPLNTTLTVRASGGSSSAEPVSVRLSDGRVARVELTMDTVARGAMFSGFVLADSTREPIAGADVVLPELGMGTVTNDEGVFRLGDVPAGTHMLLVRRVGYEPLTGQIEVADNQVLERRVMLNPIVVVEEVVVRGERSAMPGFDEHRAVGLGTFFTREDLERYNFVADVLRMVRGADIVRGNGNEAWLAGPRGTRLLEAVLADEVILQQLRCFSQVYVDRQLVFRGAPGEHPFDINSIPVADIEGIEWYSSLAQVPRRYATQDAPCGVLVIHTRRGR